MKKYIVDLLCRRCKNKLGNVKSKFNKPRLQWKLCRCCKEKSLKHVKKMLTERNQSQKQKKACSENMKKNNPMFNEQTCKKVGQTNKMIWANGTGNFHRKQSEDHIRKRFENRFFSADERTKMSHRMKQDNPMCDKKTVDKMKQTRIENVLSGKIIYKHGKDHPLWKGGCRNFNNTCRSQLYTAWIKKILNRDNYLCTMCGKRPKNGYLTVHHIKPLRKFIKEIKIKYDIETFMDIDKEDWQSYINEIVNNHKLEHGITVCRICHSDIDEYYRSKNCKYKRKKSK